MELTPGEIEELLGAWALGALEPDEHQRVERALADDINLAHRAGELCRAVVELDVELASDAPGELRDKVLALTRARPRTGDAAAEPLAVFAGQVNALDDLLGALTGDDWDRRARPYDWTVHGLVAHLLVIEKYTSSQLGLSEPTPGSAAAHLEMGAEEIADELRRPPDRTVGAWSEIAHTTIDRLRRGEGSAGDEHVEFHGWPFTANGLLIARGFEIWTHADDIRRATGQPLGAPVASELRTMSQHSVTSLPLVLPLIAPETELEGARVVLTGDGGATFDLGDPDRRTTLLVANVVDYCRLAARRIPIDNFPHDIEGDPGLARDLLAAAQVFAV